MKNTLAIRLLGEVTKGSKFESNVFLAGGAVRDMLMGLTIKDIDIVVSKPNGGIEYAEWLTKKLGIVDNCAMVTFPRYGTVSFRLINIKYDDVDLSDVEIQCVMTRSEQYTSDSRNPDVVYSSLHEDILRRDFTINTLIMDICSQDILDITEKGKKDIADRIIRTPISPTLTFIDDPLRILRGIRFAAKYRMDIEESTKQAMKACVSELKKISTNRIMDEFSKILTLPDSDQVENGLELYKEFGIMCHISPIFDEIIGMTQNEFHDRDVFGHCVSVAKSVRPNLTLRLAALLHDIGKSNTKTCDENGKIHFYGHEDSSALIAEKMLFELKFSNEINHEVCKLVKNHMRLKASGDLGQHISDKALRRIKVDMGEDLDPLLELIHADNISHTSIASMPDQIPNIRLRYEKLTEITPKLKLPVNGFDVMKALNIQGGIECGKWLAYAEDLYLDDPTLTKEEIIDKILLCSVTFEENCRIM